MQLSGFVPFQAPTYFPFQKFLCPEDVVNENVITFTSLFSEPNSRGLQLIFFNERAVGRVDDTRTCSTKGMSPRG